MIDAADYPFLMETSECAFYLPVSEAIDALSNDPSRLSSVGEFVLNATSEPDIDHRGHISLTGKVRIDDRYHTTEVLVVLPGFVEKAMSKVCRREPRAKIFPTIYKQSIPVRPTLRLVSD
jgi:hypothetical protein